MATSEFTEFSYGYALTDSLVAALGSLAKAPVFPSLIQEGKSGGGYDIELPAVPVPLFLQFKVQQVMVKASSLMPPGYAPVYYRMPIRTKAPNQHRLLIELEAAKPHALVLYATPLFHKIAELDRHYLDKTVHTRTAFVLPSAIGSLSSKPHHLSYRPGAMRFWRHSKPVPVEGDFTFNALVDRIAKASAVARNESPGSWGVQSEGERLSTQRMGATTEYFEVEVRAGQIVLTPVRIQRGVEVRAKLAALGLGDADVSEAVRWARSGAKPAALKKATRGR